MVGNCNGCYFKGKVKTQKAAICEYQAACTRYKQAIEQLEFDKARLTSRLNHLEEMLEALYLLPIPIRALLHRIAVRRKYER